MTRTLNGLCLEGTGPRDHADWRSLAGLLPSTTVAAWADLDGFHLAPLPETPPHATHLWFWAPQTWGRARIDHDHWILGLLRPTTTAAVLADLTGIDPVHNLIADLDTITPWANDDGRIAQYVGPADALRSMVQLIPRRHATAAFLADPSTVDGP